MITSYLRVLENGQVISAGYGSSEQNVVPEQGEIIIYGVEAEPGNSYYDFASACVVTIPVRPSMSHVFDYDEKTWVQDTALACNDAVTERNRLLASSDWTQLPDVPLATKEAWATYRQALRDITAQPGYPLDIVWPVSP